MINMFSLKGKSAVITGGGSGIGKAISLLFARQGAAVHVIELNGEAAAGVVNEIKEAGGEAFAHSCDVSRQEQVLKTFKEIGMVNILVNNAGIAHIGKADTTAEDDFVLSTSFPGVHNKFNPGLVTFSG